MARRREVLLDLVTAAVVVMALGIGAAHLYARLAAPSPLDAAEDRTIPEWRALAAQGHWIGPTDAPVVVLVWEDYECPACSYFERQVQLVQEEHPDLMAVVYRHWPLPSHRYAYAAARAAECAASQSRFAPFHRKLYDDPVWVGDAFLRFAQEVGVPDLDAFGECVADNKPVDSIEKDIAAVTELGGRGTPTVVVNGTYLGQPPDAPALRALITTLAKQPE